MSPKTYIIDFFNVFSDYRETFYKKQGLNFHDIKYNTLQKDTEDFFDLFFTRYLEMAHIKQDSEFIFVMKKIYNYQETLTRIITKFETFKIRFVITPDRYKDPLVESNKDDFICQYLVTIYNDSVLISNDNYKNRQEYSALFIKMHKINIEIFIKNKRINTFFIINNNIINKIDSLIFNRNSIPKYKFNGMYTSIKI